VNIQHLQKIREAQRIQRPTPATSPQAPQGDAKVDFKEVLRQARSETTEGVKLSAHAQHRIEQRQIPLTVQDIQQLNEAVSKAESKGARESLVLMQNKGFIVSIPNKTVITAVDRGQMQDNVFTNIDSTIIV